MLDSISLVSFFVLGVIGWITYKIFIWPFYVSPLRKIPGPPSESPYYGNIQKLMIKKPNFSDPQLDWVKQYGNVFKYYGLFNQPNIFVADPNIIQEMTLSKTYEFVKPYNTVAIALVGNGLVFAEGDDHKRQRKMMNPAFTHSNIKEMVPTFIRVTSTLKGLIENEINQGKSSNINLTPYISKTTLDIIGLVGFSYEFNSLTSPNELASAYDSILNSPPSTFRITLDLLLNYFPFIRNIPIEQNEKFRKACEVINRISKKLIEEKYKEAENGGLKNKDLLSLLININKTLPDEEKMTDEELKNQIMTFLLAGHETTNVTTCWALYLLSEHPHFQDSLREELVKAFPDKSKFNPTFDEINSLEFLNCVIKETLRISPPVPVVRRTNLKEEVFGEYFIPKKSQIAIGISALQKLPEIWGPTACEFNPKRWTDPSLTQNITNLNYLPFLNGARGCIGNKVALAEAKILLGTLIRNFVFQPAEGFQIRRRNFPISKPDPHLELAVSIVES